jgi:hypothetical protein
VNHKKAIFNPGCYNKNVFFLEKNQYLIFINIMEFFHPSELLTGNSRRDK